MGLGFSAAPLTFSGDRELRNPTQGPEHENLDR